MNSLDTRLRLRLDTLREKHLLRTLREVSSSQGAEIRTHDQSVVNFSSNDYLGLAAEPLLAEAMTSAARVYGTGAGASRLISGGQTPHFALEQELASWKNTPAALAFSCGYTTALGALPSLIGKGDIILMDKLSHACLVDGARMSEGILRVFPHNNLQKLRSLLEWARKAHPDAGVWILTESVFSMDGDLAPLREIVELKNEFGAWLFLDEAHAAGVVGKDGRGLAAREGVEDGVDVLMGTLGKAFGVSGGYVAASSTVIQWLTNSARSFIFSTAPPAPVAAAAAAAVRWLQTPGGLARVRSLHERLSLAAEMLSPFGSQNAESPIFPILVGSEDTALRVAAELFRNGIYAPAVRFPTVAKGAARLRVTITASHTEEQIRLLVDALGRIGFP